MQEEQEEQEELLEEEVEGLQEEQEEEQELQEKRLVYLSVRDEPPGAGEWEEQLEGQPQRRAGDGER